MSKEQTFHEKVVAIQSELKAPKNQFNSFGKYKYRSQEDILEAVKPLLFKYQLVLTLRDTIKELGGLVFVEAETILNDAEGNSVSTTAQAGIADRKGMDIAQSFGSSSSYARKYSLNALFLIDDTKDADETNDHKAEQASKWLVKDSTEYIKCKAYVDKGGSIDDIKKKYNLSKEVEELLITKTI